MKKLFLIPLMAAALMFSANARADVHATLNEGDEAKVQINGGAWQYASTLKEAFDEVAAGETANIELLKDVHLAKPITMPAAISPALLTQAGQNITLDLGGHTIKADKKVTSFRLVKGKLDIEGTGTIMKEADKIGDSTWEGISPITVFGTQSPSAVDWSVLTIGQDVTISSVGSDGKSGYGISIQDHNGANGITVADDPLKCTESDAKLIEKYGYYTYTTETNESVAANNYQKMKCGAPTESSYHQEGCAFGVKILIHGTVTAGKRGIYIVGHVNQKPSCTEDDGISKRDKTRYPNPPYYKYQYPYILVAATAHVGASEQGGCTGIYGGGYGVFDIAGEVYGATGIYMKAGDVDLQDAYVRSTSSTFTPSGGGASGVNKAGGSAVAIESNDAYAGGSGLSITGDTKVEGDGGYAIFEETYKQSGNATTTNIEIQGGTITGGHEGAIAITTGTSQAATQVTGGSISNGEVSVGGTTVNVGTLVPQTETYHTTEVDNGDGTKTVVISEGAAPEAPATPNSWAEVAAQSNETTRPNIAWTGTTDGKGAGTIASNVTVYLGELQIASGTNTNGQTLTIEDGGELNVKQLILNGYARIIVKPGGRLVVTGTQGMTAPNEDNILIQANYLKSGSFLFHPNVTSNRHPVAKIELKSKGYQYAEGKLRWQRFGAPSWKELPISAMERDASGHLIVKIENKDPENYNSWTSFKSGDKLVPFTSYAITSLSRTQNAVYTFTAEVVGNGDVELETYTTFNHFANSYTAPVNLLALLQKLVDDEYGISASAYLHDPVTDWWSDYTLGELEDDYAPEDRPNIEPMRAFMLERVNPGNNPDINYQNEIWNPIMNPSSPAPARNAQHATYAKARIEIEAEDGTKDVVRLYEGNQFSDDFDNGYEATKLMLERPTFIFANRGENKMGAIATDNLLGTTIGLTTTDKTTFTMSFSNVRDMNYAIRDMLTGTETQIVEGATYMFSVPEDATVEGRFMIVASNKVPTAIENVEVENNDKGIYNMAGQYVGTDYHILPAGVYVVDGKKIVK